MNILEKIKELKALRAELGEGDELEKQAYTETIVSLIKQMSHVSDITTTKNEEKELVVKFDATQHAKNSDFEFKETDMPETSISQIKSKTKYIPQ
jgi:hypothetical protein